MGEKDSALLYLAMALIVSGGLAILARRGRWLERSGETWWLSLLAAPYKFLGIRWIGGGVHRYLQTVGWFLMIAGVLLGLGVLIK